MKYEYIYQMIIYILDDESERYNTIISMYRGVDHKVRGICMMGYIMYLFYTHEL